MASRRGSGPPKVAFVLPNPRAELAAQVAAGEAPDSTLLGQNHLAALGVDARLHDPALTRRGGGRLRWNLREVTLPWELGDADVAFTPLAGLFPLVARAPVCCSSRRRCHSPRQTTAEAERNEAPSSARRARELRSQIVHRP